MAKSEIQTGAGCRVLVNGRIVGFATGVNWKRSIGSRYIYGIDSPYAAEIAVTGPYRIEGTISGFRLRDQGGWDGRGIMNSGRVKDMLIQPYVALELVDRRSKIGFATVRNCIFDEDSVNVVTKAQITMTANFKGIFMLNEGSENP